MFLYTSLSPLLFSPSYKILELRTHECLHEYVTTVILGSEHYQQLCSFCQAMSLEAMYSGICLLILLRKLRLKIVSWRTGWDTQQALPKRKMQALSTAPFFSRGWEPAEIPSSTSCSSWAAQEWGRQQRQMSCLCWGDWLYQVWMLWAVLMWLVAGPLSPSISPCAEPQG